MTTAAIELLREFKKLAPPEQALVRDEVNALTKARQREALERLRGSSMGEEQPDEQRTAQIESIRRVRGMFAGSGLLQALLDERAKDRKREMRHE